MTLKERFENWAAENDFNIRRSDAIEEWYFNGHSESAWKGYQACAQSLEDMIDERIMRLREAGLTAGGAMRDNLMNRIDELTALKQQLGAKE